MVSSPNRAGQKNERVSAEALFAALYSELHRLAKRQVSRQSVSFCLGATTLLHEAYIDITESKEALFPDRPRFVGYIARVMRGLIIDRVRHERAQKRGRQFEISLLDSENVADKVNGRELLLISDALDELAETDASLAELVDLKFFCGFSFAEIASMRTVSERTVQRNWERARIYLHCCIRPDLAL